MKLSVVIICWNALRVIMTCLKSIFEETRDTEFEVIVSDNGSTDGSLGHIRRDFPQVRIVENGANLGFAKGNNAGIRSAEGEYVLILNPDTIIRDRALEKLVAFADDHPEAGAFGCRVLNPDGSFQTPARPIRRPVSDQICLGNLSQWLPLLLQTLWSAQRLPDPPCLPSASRASMAGIPRAEVVQEDGRVGQSVTNVRGCHEMEFRDRSIA